MSYMEEEKKKKRAFIFHMVSQGDTKRHTSAPVNQKTDITLTTLASC